jgi:hypothetical protein
MDVKPASLACIALLIGSGATALAQTPSPRTTSIAVHSVSVELPAGTDAFPPGPGSDVAGKCLICHSAGMVLKQPALTQAQWKAEIEKMRSAYGAPIDDGEVDGLSVYLAGISASQQGH